MRPVTILLLVICVTRVLAVAVNQEKEGNKQVGRQLEYVSLINTLLQQTNVLSSVDGILLAATTVLASIVTRIKPFLIASSLSYLAYVGTAIIFPASLSQLGLPVLEVPDFRTTGRSMDGGARMFEGALTETLTQGLKMSPIMNIITNVSVTVVSETMSRLRMISKLMIQQLSRLQVNMLWLGRALSSECTSKFLCRVGQFTETNFPTASSLLRTVADTYPKMDDYAVAIVRGTSSANCSLIYPDCTV